jgi:condensin complex subunit 3
MGDHTFIDDNLCDQITISMMDRLLDKSPKVRAQAVLALQKPQDPSDNLCPIIRMYLFHLSKDPSNKVHKVLTRAKIKKLYKLHWQEILMILDGTEIATLTNTI